MLSVFLVENVYEVLQCLSHEAQPSLRGQQRQSLWDSFSLSGRSQVVLSRAALPGICWGGDHPCQNCLGLTRTVLRACFGSPRASPHSPEQACLTQSLWPFALVHLSVLASAELVWDEVSGHDSVYLPCSAQNTHAEESYSWGPGWGLAPWVHPRAARLRPELRLMVHEAK